MKWRAVVALGLFLISVRVLAQEYAIRAGNLIDPASGSVQKNQIILVKEGKITEVGEKVQIPKDASIIDLSGSWVMPGLMDAHTHLTFTIPTGSIEIMSSYLKESTALRALQGARNARLVLEAGFTTVRDVGNAANYADVDLRRAIERGWFVGPTIIACGKIIAAFGGQSYGVPPEQGPFWQFEYIDADTPDEMRKAVRRNIYYGANAIKLVADNSAYHYTLEELKAAVTETHDAGMAVAIHVMGGEPARRVILSGAESIEHGFDLSDEMLQLMKEKGTVLVGTDFPEEHLKAMGFNAVKDGKTLGQRIVDRLRRAYKVGVKMVFGTDIVVELPNRTRADMALDYLDVWLAAGVPPAHILKCMTTNAAELLRIQKERGSIAAGLAADIIATSDNPLENIRALKNVSFVMKDGKLTKQVK